MIIVPVEKKIDWKRPPIVLISLVLINILMFAFYQSDDDYFLYEAVQNYQQEGLLNVEWSAYKAYLRQHDRLIEFDKNDENLPYYIVSDSGFDRFLRLNADSYIPSSKRQSWRYSRDSVEQISSRISSNALGFHASDMSPIQMISYQFLHGGIMHIVGNLVFLILVGFAVEAALGSRTFLIFYLISGVGSALIFALLSPPTGGALVGASGSISGVMAMYVVLFGARKIQFFYWFLIFTGYLRATAIIMLPFYIMKEIYSIATTEGSNVAYTAHIGGFVIGALLVYGLQKLQKDVIDEGYLNNEESEVDLYSQELDVVYNEVARCEFAKAWKLLKPLKQSHPNASELIELEFNLVRALHPKKRKEYLVHRLDKKGNTDELIRAQLTWWKNTSELDRSNVSDQKKSGLLQGALDLKSVSIAEEIFIALHESSFDSLELAVFARRLSFLFETDGHSGKDKHYKSLAQNLAGSQASSSGKALI